MTLLLSSQPGFAEVPDQALDAGQPAGAAVLKALNAAAKFAAVRTEQFWGYYQHGETVALPISAADGYAYAREELLYSPSLVSTGAAMQALNGTHTLPGYGSTSGKGTLLQIACAVNQETGVVECIIAYWKDSQENTHDGIHDFI